MNELITRENKECRCGYEGPYEDHPCHGDAYTCRKPAKIRFYNPELVSLAGMQMKFQMSQTWACDACWEKHQYRREAAIQQLKEKNK